jgi:hypothetical protein
MKKLLSFFLISLTISTLSQSQTILEEGFEGLDSLSLPLGWTQVNFVQPPADTMADWTVRDTGASLPGLATATSVAHTGTKAIGVSWWSGCDTNGCTISDDWLITRRVFIPTENFELSFWATGGSPSWLDSMQVRISTTDSLPASFTDHLQTIVFGPGPYGVFQEYFFDLTPYSGQTIWVAFRYHCDVNTAGFFVHLDDVKINNPIGIQGIGSNVPSVFALRQNYPNPFNPVTFIEFDLPKSEYVELVVFNSLGQQVKTLVEQDMNAGSYRVDFDARNLPSGTYYYRLIAGNFVETKKMVIVK